MKSTNSNLLTPGSTMQKGDDLNEEKNAMLNLVQIQMIDTLNQEMGPKTSISDQDNKQNLIRRMSTLKPPNKINNSHLLNESHPKGKILLDSVTKDIMNRLEEYDVDVSKPHTNKPTPTLSVISIEENNSTHNSRILTETKIKNPVEKLLDVFELNQVEARVNFYCDNKDLKMSSHFLPNSGLLEINVYSQDGCPINFEFLQLLNEIPWITGSVFLILGLGLTFFGLKVYKNLLMVFIPMMIAILGFYLYFAFVENSTTSTTKILTLVGLLVFIFALAILMVWFNWLLYFIVAFGVSCQFGLITHAFLEKNISFFQTAYTEWILIVIFFIIFFAMYFFIKDYFLILATAIMGSLFIILSLKYLGLTDYDLLFDTQLDKLAEFDKLDNSVQMVAIIFLCSLIFGSIVQIILLKKQQKKEEELNKNNDHQHDSHKNIQLENI